MKAMAYTDYEPPDVLKFKEVERPAIADDEVLVEVHTASINFGDVSRIGNRSKLSLERACRSRSLF